MKTEKLVLLSSCFCLALCCLGCNSEANSVGQVQGTLTVDGQLAKSGTVTFHSEDSRPTAYGLIANDGSFALRIGQGSSSTPNHNDIPTGTYTATVAIRGPAVDNPNGGPGAPPLAGPLLVDEKYTSKEKSGLEFRVKPGLNQISIAVEGPGPAEDKDSEESEIEQDTEELSETEEAVDKILTEADDSGEAKSTEAESAEEKSTDEETEEAE